MNLKKLSHDKQVSYLRSLLGSRKNAITGYFAMFAFRHHLASKHSSNFTTKPVLRWYLGQLAKTFISKYFNEIKENLENFAEIGLLETKDGPEPETKEYHLNETVYPALIEVLEEIFGKEYIANEISRAKYFRNPGQNKTKKLDENFSEVKE